MKNTVRETKLEDLVRLDEKILANMLKDANMDLKMDRVADKIEEGVVMTAEMASLAKIACYAMAVELRLKTFSAPAHVV
jgi:ribosomal protein S16